jgi:hypothetical protein
MSVGYNNRKINPGGLVTKCDYIPALLYPYESFPLRKCNKCGKHKLAYAEFGRRYYKKLKPDGRERRIKYTLRAQCKKCYNEQRQKRRFLKKISAIDNVSYMYLSSVLFTGKPNKNDDIFELGKIAPYFRFVDYPIILQPSMCLSRITF